MSWALEEWKSGLSSRAMQKIAEYESQLEKLKKERQQKQLQLDSLEVAFQKQNQKLEGEKNENASLKRETQNLTEACNNLEKAQQRLCHEIQVKEALVCSLEGQLLAAKKQIDKQEQELKRLEAELERSQRASATTECQLLPTPTKSYPGCTMPSRAIEDSKWDELQEKYNQAVEEKKRLGSEVKALKLQVQHLQFSSNKSHRESAPQQIRASTFSWQQEKAPTRVPESPVRHGSSSSVFPWEQPKTSAYHNSRSLQQNNEKSNLALDSNNDHLEESVSVQVQELKKENQVLQCTMSELEVWVQSQEKEIKNHLNKLQEVQLLLEKSKGELAVKEQALSKSRDDLERAAVQQEQTKNKCALLEQKLKQLSEELNCQRQNGESVRRTMEQKSKNREKEYQQELSDQQRAYRSLEHQCKQEKNQLNQEIQQLKTEHLALQAKINKMATGKQLVDKELEEVKAKFQWAEKELATRQKNGDDLQKSLQCALKEKERISTWQEQSAQRIIHLETQLKRLEQQLALSQRSREEMKAENLALASLLKDLQVKLDHQNETNPERMDPSVTLCKLSENEGVKVSKSNPNEEQRTCQSNDGESSDIVTVLELQVEAKEKILDLMEDGQLGKLEQMEMSVNLDPGTGDDMEKDHFSDMEVNLETKQCGKSVERQILGRATDTLPCSEEGIKMRLPEFKEEVKKELEASAAEPTVMPREPEEKGEGVDQLDKPIAACAHLGELELKLEELQITNQMLQCELDNVKQELENKMTEGQKGQQTVAELRRKLKQVMKKCATEAEHSSALAALQTEQISVLEKELEQERVLVGKLQETNKMLEIECRKVSQLSRSKDGHVGSNDEIQILQHAASKKIQQLEQQIIDLKGEKSCIEEIIKANDGAVNEENRDLLEYFKHKDVQSLELNHISSVLSSHLYCDAREKIEHKLDEEKIYFMEIMKEDEGADNVNDSQDLFLECLKHKVLEQSEFNDQLQEHQKHLTELQQKCDELTREKEEEGEAKRQAQDMFDHLQSRIHRETQQLTVALETQSKNIEGLLLSLEEKDHTIEVLNGRLQSALKTLSCLYQENQDLKANLKTVTETSKENYASPSKGAVLEQSCGQIPQANQSACENSSSLSIESLGLGKPSSSVQAVDEDTQKSESETVQRLKPSHHENVLDNSLLLIQDQVTEVIPSCYYQYGEPKMPLLNSPALQNVLETKEVVEKQQQQIKDVEVIYYKNGFTDKSVVPNEQKTSSILPTEVPQGKAGMTSTLKSPWQTVAQVKQDIESQWQPKELGCDAVQNRQHVRCLDSLQVKVGELEEGLSVIHDEVAQSETETPIKERAVENADTQTNVPDLEEKSVDEFIEEVEGMNRKLNEDLNVLKKENTDMNELNQRVVHTLNEQLSCLNEKCTVLEQEKEQLSLEVQRVQKAASDLQCEKENLVTAIQSIEAQLNMSTDKQKYLQEELEALQEWRQKVLEGVATLETQKEGSQVELHSLQGSVRDLQNHVETLEGQRRAWKDAAENAKHLQRQLQQELEQAHSEKSVLQNQVEHLQNIAAELNKEKMYLQGKLKQWESPPEDKEVPTDCLQQRGLQDDLHPTNNHQQAPAQITARKIRADLEALKQAVQEKSKEVDQNLLDYTDLLNQHQELEMTNDAWSTATQLLNDQAESENQEMDSDCEPESLTDDGVTVTGQQMVDHLVEKVEQDQTETSQRSNYNSQLPDASAKLNPAELAMKINPAELAARIRRSRQFRHHLSVAFDETEYEPYGLPDVVQKGFADIPSGSFCPHVLRRGILNSTFCPRQQEEGLPD